MRSSADFFQCFLRDTVRYIEYLQTHFHFHSHFSFVLLLMQLVECWCFLLCRRPIRAVSTDFISQGLVPTTRHKMLLMRLLGSNQAVRHSFTGLACKFWSQHLKSEASLEWKGWVTSTTSTTMCFFCLFFHLNCFAQTYTKYVRMCLHAPISFLLLLLRHFFEE